MVNLTPKQIDFYKKQAEGIDRNSKDIIDLDSDRCDSIDAEACLTVTGGHELTSASFFRSDAEYKYYLILVMEYAMAAERGLI